MVDALHPPRLRLSVCSNSLTIPGALGRLLSCRQIGHAIAAWARRASPASGRLDLELDLAHVHGGARSRRLGRVHCAERLGAGIHVLRGREVWSTTAVPCSPSYSTFRPVVGTPGGGPSDPSMRARSPSIRSALTSLNLTTRTYTAATSTIRLTRPYRSARRQARISTRSRSGRRPRITDPPRVTRLNSSAVLPDHRRGSRRALWLTTATRDSERPRNRRAHARKGRRASVSARVPETPARTRTKNRVG